MPYLSAQATKSIRAISYVVTLTVTPSPPWRPGQQVTLNVQITPIGVRTIDLWIVIPGKISYNFDSVTTAPDGTATYRYTIPWTILGVTVPCNIIYFRAIEAETGAVSNDVEGACAYPTRISISAPDTVGVGASFAVTGKLEYESASGVWSPLAGRTVSIYYNNTKLADVTTDSEGRYTATVSIPSAGTYTLKAVYAGEGLTAAAAAMKLITVPGEIAGPLFAFAPVAVGGIVMLASRHV